MFFMSHVLVFTIYFYEISSFPRRVNNSNITDCLNGNGKNDPKNTEQLFTAQNPMFHIVKNLTSTRSNNLKLNVFDKMLSDEMFSIKQRFFEKDLAYTTTGQKMTKNSVATPTLEVKQKWPVVDQFTRSFTTEDLSEKGAILEYESKLKGTLNKYPKIKSLDVRSLSDHLESSMHSPAIKCNCGNAKANHQCKHGDGCTRQVPHGTTVVISPPPMYLPYQAYFISDNNEHFYQNTHYHPKVINELKIPKSTRRRKPTTLPDEDLYYDDDKKKQKSSKDDREIIMNIDYDVQETKKPGYALNCVHEDLNEVFSKGVQRKCYCSLSQRNMSQYGIIFICLLMSLQDILDWNYNKI